VTVFIVNGQKIVVELDPRESLLGGLHGRLQLFGTKKGCDHGNGAPAPSTSTAAGSSRA
jgi:aerobic-type carbon monoxide dehydrogenase small subunit (CoxS/CutS family)